MPISGPHKRWKYDLHPSVAMAHSAIAGMKQKTGRSLDEWVHLAKKHGPAGEKERTAWLKREHGLGTNHAGWIAGRSLGKPDATESPDEYLKQADAYVEKMFAGPKEQLRAIYDEILTFARTLGPDIRVSPCQTFVPIYRSHVIAQVKPTTRTRIDLGLALRDTKAPKRLIDTGGFAKKDRITHRIEIGEPEDFDDEAKRWMKKAYDMDM
ncbi:MAG TPA: DUF5655 domain-containing protein [Bryocella sp.]|nr:DUF5655 domain-containing protein [Bryocella sp.]